MQEVVSEVFFYHIALVAAADHEVVYPVVGIGLHDVSQNGLATDLNHWFRTGRGFFGDSGSEATGENDCFHIETLW